jgi:hypothetical protein
LQSDAISDRRSNYKSKDNFDSLLDENIKLSPGYTSSRSPDLLNTYGPNYIKQQINRINPSWHKFGQWLPSESQKHMSDVELYNNWEAYWQMVDIGMIKPTNNPNLYYYLKG